MSTCKILFLSIYLSFFSCSCGASSMGGAAIDYITMDDDRRYEIIKIHPADGSSNYSTIIASPSGPGSVRHVSYSYDESGYKVGIDGKLILPINTVALVHLSPKKELVVIGKDDGHKKININFIRNLLIEYKNKDVVSE